MSKMKSYQRLIIGEGTKDSTKSGSIIDNMCGVWSQGSDERGGEYLCQSPPPNALSNFRLLSTDHGDDIYFDGVLNRHPAFALHFGV